MWISLYSPCTPAWIWSILDRQATSLFSCSRIPPPVSIPLAVRRNSCTLTGSARPFQLRLRIRIAVILSDVVQLFVQRYVSCSHSCKPGHIFPVLNSSVHFGATFDMLTRCWAPNGSMAVFDFQSSIPGIIYWTRGYPGIVWRKQTKANNVINKFVAQSNINSHLKADTHPSWLSTTHWLAPFF